MKEDLKKYLIDRDISKEDFEIELMRIFGITNKHSKDICNTLMELEEEYNPIIET